MSIYKFVNDERIDILENLKIRFTQPKEFNDPFEMYPYIESLLPKEFFNKVLEKQNDKEFEKNYLEGIPKEYKFLMTDKQWIEYGNDLKPIIEPFAKAYINNLFDISAKIYHKNFQSSVNNAIGIFCSTKRRDDLRMWGHYANSHKGYVIIFNENHPFFTQQGHKAEELRKIKAVFYAYKRPKVTYLMNLNSYDLFFTKSNDWKYEQEFRMIRPLKEADYTINDSIFLFNLPPEAIQGVCLGSRMTEENINKIKSIFKNNEVFKNKILIQCNLNESEYKINFKAV